jgi:hypothetical protein
VSEWSVKRVFSLPVFSLLLSILLPDVPQSVVEVVCKGLIGELGRYRARVWAYKLYSIYALLFAARPCSWSSPTHTSLLLASVKYSVILHVENIPLVLALCHSCVLFSRFASFLISLRWTAMRRSCAAGLTQVEAGCMCGLSSAG